ncbi:hypothetical protein SAMN06298216_2670 [Spirosomataceae bacterium TFI 002]|nr:hypothetical protein SAMN06298216_2670 [Spirosomataceae bacterium TFI 002]
MSLPAFTQKSYNAFIGFGGRVYPNQLSLPKPLQIVFGVKLVSYKDKFELLTYGIGERNFKSNNSIGLGLKATYFKRYLPKTFYLFLDSHLSYYSVVPTFFRNKLINCGTAGVGYILSKQNWLELGAGWDTGNSYVEKGGYLRMAYIHAFNINLKRDKKFKQNPKKQLECPKLVGV